MSQKVERLIVPRCPVLKCKESYKLILACKDHTNFINSNLLGFINMHPVHEEPVHFDPRSGIIETKEISFTQKESLMQENIINYSAGLEESVIKSEECSDGSKEEKKSQIQESDKMIVTASINPKTYLKKINIGSSPTEQVSEKACKNVEDNIGMFHSKTKPQLAPKLSVLPVAWFKKDKISELKTQNNVKFIPTLKVNKNAFRILPGNIGSQSISIKNRPVGKPLLKAEVKMIKKVSEPNNTLDKALLTKTNFQGKKIVIVTKNNNIILKPLTTPSNPELVILRQPVKSMQSLNDKKIQVKVSNSNMQFKKVLLTGSKQIKKISLDTDSDKNNDKIMETEDNLRCGNRGEQTDKKSIEFPLKDNYNELNNISKEEIKLLNFNLNNVPNVSSKKILLKSNHSNVKSNKDGSDKKSGATESNYSVTMEGNLSKDAITEIILGKCNSNPLKTTFKANIAASIEEKKSETLPEVPITLLNGISNYIPRNRTSEDATPVEIAEKYSKTSSETRKRQITTSYKNNKKLCLSERVNEVGEKPEVLNDINKNKFPVEDNTNKINDTKVPISAGNSSTFQHKEEVSDIEHPKQAVLPETDLFGNDLGNFDDFLKDLGKFDIIESSMQSEPFSWGPLLIDEDISETGSDIRQNKLLHGYQRLDPFLTKAGTKPKYKKWQLMFFWDMKISLRKDFAGNMPIHEAVLKDDMKTLHKQCLALLARIKTVDVRNNEGSTPLHLAILNRVNPDVISVLLKFKASVTTIDNEGNNAFHLAAYSSDVEYVRRLLEHSNGQQARSDVANFDGLTPLMISVLNNDYVIVEQLLLGGFSPNLRDQKSGRTALFHAVEKNNERLVKLLLYHGGDTRIENYFGTSTHDAVYELSNVKVSIKALIHEKKKAEKTKRNKNSGRSLVRNNHINDPEGNYRTYGEQCKRFKLEHED